MTSQKPRDWCESQKSILFRPNQRPRCVENEKTPPIRRPRRAVLEGPSAELRPMFESWKRPEIGTALSAPGREEVGPISGIDPRGHLRPRCRLRRRRRLFKLYQKGAPADERDIPTCVSRSPAASSPRGCFIEGCDEGGMSHGRGLVVTCGRLQRDSGGLVVRR